MEEIEIRQARQEDFKIILQFINSLEKTDFNEDQLLRIYAENISNSKNYYWVALLKEEVIGYVSCHAQNLLHHAGLIGEIQELYVNPAYRGRNVGRDLVDKIKELALRDGFVQLEVTTNSQRLIAQQFYMKEGFAQTHFKFIWKLSYL